MSVLVVGESLIDVIGVEGRSPLEHVGGSPLNVSVGLARLGVQATLATQLGDDTRGEMVRDHLERSAVTLARLDPVRFTTSTATATLSGDGAATYVFDLVWDPDGLPDVRGFEALHVGSLAAAMLPGAEVTWDAVKVAASHGIPVSFDPNVRLAVEPDIGVWQTAFATILPYVSHLKMSDEDAAVLAPGAAPADLAQSLAAPGRLVAVTCGAHGSHLASPLARCQVAPGPVDLVDTIGAGDSYMAALLARSARRRWPGPDLMAEADLRELGAFAAAAAAVTCSRPGADPPWTSELGPLTRR
jgi:fructokinase